MDSNEKEDRTNVVQFRIPETKRAPSDELIAEGLQLVEVFMTIASAEGRQRLLALARQLAQRSSGDPA